jgi:hypothetical protein
MSLLYKLYYMIIILKKDKNDSLIEQQWKLQPHRHSTGGNTSP